MHLIQQAAVDRGHDFCGDERAAVRGRNALARFRVKFPRPRRLEIHEREKTFVTPARSEVFARDAKTGALQPIATQINAVADKAAAIARLQQTPTAQRRVAMMVYNYPQGEGNFGASFLNVPKSLHNMLGRDEKRGLPD